MTTEIKGYRTLSAEETALINEIKSVGEDVKELLKKVEALVGESQEEHGFADADAYRFLAMSKSNLQLGFMLATRAIARPSTFA